MAASSVSISIGNELIRRFGGNNSEVLNAKYWYAKCTYEQFLTRHPKISHGEFLNLKIDGMTQKGVLEQFAEIKRRKAPMPGDTYCNLTVTQGIADIDKYSATEAILVKCRCGVVTTMTAGEWLARKYSYCGKPECMSKRQARKHNRREAKKLRGGY